MKRFLSRGVIVRWGAVFSAPQFLAGVVALPRYLAQLYSYKKAAPQQRVMIRDLYPCLTDNLNQTPFDPHYFYQGAWLARRVSETKPTLHVDVGSSVTMVGVLSASTTTVFLDYRPLVAKMAGLRSVAGSVTHLPFCDNSISSLSSLHVVEHVGLGRYGDPLDVEGTKRSARELERVLEPGGRLFLSVPVGRERVCFNAHRVHAPRSILSFLPGLRMESFALVDDAGNFHEPASVEGVDHLDYGCGMFEFVKTRG